MSLDDLDDMVRETNSRPSFLLTAFGVAGFALGNVAKVSPQICSSLLTGIVHDVAEQSLNDSIREMTATPSNEDVRETLKYHRDFRSSSSSSSFSTTATTSVPNDSSDPRVEGVKTVVTTALVGAVKLADTF
jgi:demethoxyubiquinone hydroxylase (CLK1/Coq7/Cat5 family)